jgi:hypothetical protein
MLLSLRTAMASRIVLKLQRFKESVHEFSIRCHGIDAVVRPTRKEPIVSVHATNEWNIYEGAASGIQSRTKKERPTPLRQW